MLVNLYKSKSPAAVVSLPVMIALIGLSIFWMPVDEQKNTFFWQDAFTNYLLQNQLIKYLISVAVVYFSSIELNRQVNVFDFFSKNTYLPGFLYGICVFGFGHFGYVNELIAILFLVYGMAYLFRLSRQESAISPTFMSGVLFGLATVFQPALLPILLLPWIALSVFRSFFWREWLALILAGGLPWFQLLAIKFIATGHLGLEYYKIELAQFNWSYELSVMSLYVFSILLSLAAFWKYLVIARTSLLVFKKRSRIVYNAFWLLAISYVVSYYLLGTLSIVLIVPMTYVVSVFMLNARSLLMANSVVYIWLLLAAWSLYHYFSGL